jgi:hypothetical protein
VVTIDGAYHDATDVEWAIRQSAAGGGGLSGKWLDSALASYGSSGAGSFDLGNLGEDYTTADADAASLEGNLVDSYYLSLKDLVLADADEDAVGEDLAGFIDIARAAIDAAGGGAGDPDTEDAIFTATLKAVIDAGLLDTADEDLAAAFGEADQQCLWTATLTTPLFGASETVVPATGAANVAGELIIKFGSDVQTFVADDVYYDGANFISGVITSTTDAADSPVMELNVNGSKATASAS